MECTFTCSWFYSYRSECVASPCLAAGTACEAAGAPSGSECANWCCVYEPVRGLVFLPVAIAAVFLICVLSRCCCRWVITSRRKSRAMRKAQEDEPEFDASDDDVDEDVSSLHKGNDGPPNDGTAHEPIALSSQMHHRRVMAPTTQNFAYPLDRSPSPAALKDVSSISPAPQPPSNIDDDQSEDSGSRHHGSRKPWYA